MTLTDLCFSETRVSTLAVPSSSKGQRVEARPRYLPGFVRKNTAGCL